MQGYILFITPHLPYPTGGGPAMRASIALDVLASLGPVIVVNPTMTGDEGNLVADQWVRDRSAAFFRIPLERVSETKSIVQGFLDSVPGSTFEVIYAFKQQVGPIALSCLGLAQHGLRGSFLDLDDDELNRDAQFVPLYKVAGDSIRAAELEKSLPRANFFRQMLMGRFQHLLLASPGDCRSMREKYPQYSFTCLPNVVRPVQTPGTEVGRDPSRILFVGTLCYLPNEDGVEMFAREILPLIHQEDPSICFRVVGMGRSEKVRLVGELPGVDLVGPVAELAPEYAAASMLVVPLRAGSGTRIKILEAFSHRTPVVSTSIGAEGLAVTHGEHLLIADTPAEFADCCLRLARDPVLREKLVGSAYEWVVREHSIETVRRTICDCLNNSKAQ